MIKRKQIKIVLVIVSIFLFHSCGQNAVELEQTYEPKLVIQALIYPDQQVEGIFVTRNIPINTNPDPLSVVIPNVDLRITDLSTGQECKLYYNSQKFSYENKKDNFIIQYDREYKITVTGTVEGKTLSAYSITKTPKKGFSIIRSNTISGEISYRELDAAGNVKLIPIKFNISEGTIYYPISIVALDASVDNFIYNNAYQEVSRNDVINKLDNYKYQQRQLQNVNPLGKTIEYNLNWTSIWFYSKYRMIIYAADENFRQFALTYRNVQEFDGNFHEPRINITGDAIGVFGSLIADTVYFSVKK